MKFKFAYNTIEERDNILKENENLYLIEDFYLLNERYLVLTDEEPEQLPLSEMQIIQEKLFNLEAENKSLKQELLIYRG